MLAVLLRLGLCAILLGSPADLTSAASFSPLHPASEAHLHRSDPVPGAPLTAASSPSADTAEVNVSINGSNDLGDAIFEFIVLTLIIGLLLLVVGTFIGGFAAVSIFMDTGCLRFVVFGLGWLPACVGGFLIGILLSELTGWDALASTAVYVGFWGYPIGWAWGLRRAKQLPREKYVTWKRTLTSGAVLGTGAGSALGMLRSAALFKGGGGSFGGGGASGSFGGASAGGGGAAAVKTGTASAGEVAALGGASGIAHTVGSSPGKEHQPRSGTAARSSSQSSASRLWRRIQKAFRWMQHLRWYHGCAFVLVVLIFVPVGLGAAAWLQDRNVLIIVTVAVVLMGGYRLFRRWAASTTSADSPTSQRTSFQGGGSADSWH